MRIAFVRTAVRLLHLLAAAALGAFAYSPWREEPAFIDVVRWGLMPALGATGLWLWLGARWLARRPGVRSVPMTAGGGIDALAEAGRR